MKTRMLVAAALLLAGSSVSAYADDPIYVVRPSIGQARTAVLPQNAFSTSSAPTTPTTPTPPSSGLDFTSAHWSASPWLAGEAVNNNTAVNGTISLSSGNRYEAKFLPKVGFCNISESPASESVKKNDVMVVPDMQWSSKEERFIEPKVTGKFAIVFLCDAVGNQPPTSAASRYYGKLLLTVTP